MRVIAEGLFTDEAQPRLVGGRHRENGRVVFPCPADTGYEARPLTRRGKLWSWTVQRYRPKTPPYAGPDAFRPWVVGYVELAGETIVEARLTDVDVAEIVIGMDLEMVPAPLDPESADPLLIPAFRPVELAR